MKQLVRFLMPVLNLMRRGPGWFFFIMLVTVAGIGFIGIAIARALGVHGGLPSLTGLFIGAAVFIGLFILMMSTTKPPGSNGL